MIFEWHKDGHKLTNSEHIHIEERSGSFSLVTFSNLSTNDSGLYECTAKNGDGMDTTSTRLVVQGLTFFDPFFFSHSGIGQNVAP